MVSWTNKVEQWPLFYFLCFLMCLKIIVRSIKETLITGQFLFNNIPLLTRQFGALLHADCCIRLFNSWCFCISEFACFFVCFYIVKKTEWKAAFSRKFTSKHFIFFSCDIFPRIQQITDKFSAMQSTAKCLWNRLNVNDHRKKVFIKFSYLR